MHLFRRKMIDRQCSLERRCDVVSFARISTMIALCLFLAACGTRGKLDYVTKGQQAQNQTTVLVATDRDLDADGTFGKGRADITRYASYTISIPPNHKVGQIEWAGHSKVNPKKHFAIASAHRFATAGAFKARLARMFQNPAARTPDGRREVTLYVHGYNTNYAEALYRVAQIKHDYGMESPIVLYSWPSAGATGLYVYDRDSVKFARDNLAQTIRMLALADVDQISLVAHSMGSELLMETIRQIYLIGDKAVQRKIASIILMSPDLDIDVFNSQIRKIRPLPQPFMIFASQKDEALEISSFLTGKEQRVGNNIDASRIENKKIKVIDVTGFQGGDPLNHFAVATSPTLVALLKGLRNSNPQALINPKQPQVITPLTLLSNITGAN